LTILISFIDLLRPVIRLITPRASLAFAAPLCDLERLTVMMAMLCSAATRLRRRACSCRRTSVACLLLAVGEHCQVMVWLPPPLLDAMGKPSVVEPWRTRMWMPALKEVLCRRGKLVKSGQDVDRGWTKVRLLFMEAHASLAVTRFSWIATRSPSAEGCAASSQQLDLRAEGGAIRRSAVRWLSAKLPTATSMALHAIRAAALQA
jgi:hypothetical protein